MADLEMLRGLANRLFQAVIPGRDIDADLHKLLGGPVSPATVDGTYRMLGTEYWKCFHCGETFGFDQPDAAREHFGETPNHVPLCCSYTGSVDAALALLERLIGPSLDHILRRHGSNAEPEWEFIIERRIRGVACESVFAPTAPLAILRATVMALIAREGGHG